MGEGQLRHADINGLGTSIKQTGKGPEGVVTADDTYFYSPQKNGTEKIYSHATLGLQLWKENIVPVQLFIIYDL